MGTATHPFTQFAENRRARAPHGARLFPLPPPGVGISDHLAAVDAVLHASLDEVRQHWDELCAGEQADVLGDSDVPALIGQLLAGGGKRIRPTMCHLGWRAAGGDSRDDRDDPRQDDVVTISAALELLHLFALVHDDVMDESDSRRGRPSVHRQAERRHRDAAAVGDPALFGTSIAILVGDLALAEAGVLVARLPGDLRRQWRHLVVELVAGQRKDLDRDRRPPA